MRAATLGLALGAGLAAIGAAGAVDRPEDIDCATASSTPELGWCAEQAQIAADRALNRLLARVRDQIKGNKELEAGQRASWASDLERAQSHWLAFRAADCRKVVGWEWHGGTGLGAAINGCLAAKSTARAKELAERYNLADAPR